MEGPHAAEKLVLQSEGELPYSNSEQLHPAIKRELIQHCRYPSTNIYNKSSFSE